MPMSYVFGLPPDNHRSMLASIRTRPLQSPLREYGCLCSLLHRVELVSSTTAPTRPHNLVSSLSPYSKTVSHRTCYRIFLCRGMFPSRSTPWELDPSLVCEGYELSKNSQAIGSSRLKVSLCSARVLRHPVVSLF